MSDNATYFGEFVDTYRQFFIHLNNTHNLALFYETLASMGLFKFFIEGTIKIFGALVCPIFYIFCT